MKPQFVIRYEDYDNYCPEAIVKLGGSGVNQDAESKSPHSPTEFYHSAALNVPDPPNYPFR